jgi:hypothetical protein
MERVYVKWDSLHEKIVCVHSSKDNECHLCKKAHEVLDNVPYFLHGGWYEIDAKEPTLEDLIDKAYTEYVNTFIGYDDIPTKDWFAIETKNNKAFANKWLYE